MKALVQFLLLSLSLSSAKGAFIEGEIKFTLGKPGARSAINREFGDDLKARCDWKIVDLMERETLFAGAHVRNTGSNSLWFIYSVAFFDENKQLIGGASFPFLSQDPLLPGKTHIIPAITYLPRGRYQDITSYQAILYELDEPVIKTRKKPVELEDPEKRGVEKKK